MPESEREAIKNTLEKFKNQAGGFQAVKVLISTKTGDYYRGAIESIDDYTVEIRPTEWATRPPSPTSIVLSQIMTVTREYD